MARKQRGEKRSDDAIAGDRKRANSRQQRSDSGNSVWLISVALAVLTLTAYWPVSQCGFLNLDDDAYVEFAPMVNLGLRSAAVVWAFTTAHSNNWHPLTSLSHMLDCNLFGVRAGPMHIENVCWHAANSILLFLFWKGLTGSRWRSAFLAGLFALHPLHVESVAWISERKDVLSTFFLLVSLMAYVSYVRGKFESRNSVVRAPWFVLSSRAGIWYAASLILYALALLCKPMVVTLPLLLLLLDFWPLGRFKVTIPTGGALPRRCYEILLEKLPFFSLALAVGIVTLLVQIHTGAANYAARFAFSARLGNAAVSYARYLVKTFGPARLSVFYHHPGFWPTWTVIGCGVILLSISIVAWWQRRARPWIAFGWLWFLISLLPVIGLIQVGAQAMADRYTYLPLIGVFAMVAWALPSASIGADTRRRIAFRIVSAISILVLAACFFLTRREVRAWQDNISLYQHSIDNGEDNVTIRYLLACALKPAGTPESEVLAQFRRALVLDPTYVNAMTQLAINALSHGDKETGRRLIERTIELEPKNPVLHKNLGAFYARTGDVAQGILHFEAALRLDPNYGDAHHELAWIYLQQNKIEPAIHELQAVVRSDPWDAQSLYELGDALAKAGRIDEARHDLERAIWILPTHAQARERLNRLR